MKKSEIVQSKGKYKYFQPVITNNTMVVSARVTEDKEETMEKNKVYKFKVNLSEEKGDSIEKITVNKEDEINNKVIENIREQLQKEMAAVKLEEESAISEAPELKNEKVEEATETEEEKTQEAKAEEAVETKEEKIQEEKAEEVVETEDKIEDIKVEDTDDEKMDALEKDLTTKLDLPLMNEAQDNSVPFRREAPDNIKEFKVKLFLLATNAKKPVRILVNRKRFLIGSDFEQMDCVIRNNQYISRCHAKIYYESDCYYLEDAGSMNGTYINGVKLAEGLKYKLISGDIINLADCRFEVSMK